MSAVKVKFWKGQLIELQNTEGELFQTQVINLNEQAIYIQAPINRRKEAMNVQSGMNVTVYFQSESHKFCSFEEQLKYHNERLAIRIPFASEVHTAQRRHYFRVPAMLDITVQFDEETETHADSTAASVDTFEPAVRTLPALTTKDISGGGLSFVCPIKLTADLLIAGQVHLYTKNYDKMATFEAQVINSRKSGGQYIVSCEFINMKEVARQQIIQYCLQRQIELKKKLG